MSDTGSHIGMVYIQNYDDGTVHEHQILFEGIQHGIPTYSIENHVYGLTVDELWEELAGKEFEMMLDSVHYRTVRKEDGIHIRVNVGPKT